MSTTPPTDGHDSHAIEALPKALAAQSQPLSGAEFKELVVKGLEQWGEYTRAMVTDKANEREHDLKLATLEYQHEARENDAERALEERTDRRVMYFVCAVGAALLIVFMVLLFTGHAELASTVMKYLVAVASGIGLGQVRPVRAFFENRRRRKHDEEASDESD